MKSTRDIKKALAQSGPARPPIPDDAWLSTGSTILNLAVSGRWDGGIPKGTYAYLVGDSEAAKSWIGLSLFAEATANKSFKDYRLIHDNAENGTLMDVEKFFGKKTARRIEPPAGTRADPRNSSTAREFYFNVDSALRSGTPFVYLLDSMDALDTEEDEEKFLEEKSAHERGQSAKGTYGMAKAKANSQHIKRIVTGLTKAGSILVVISQTRDAIRTNPYGPTRTRAGGKALKFYSHLELWTSVGEKKKVTVNDRDRVVGTDIVIDVTKNRVNGWHGKVTVPFYRSAGLDDTGACVDYLLSERHWTKARGGVIQAKELGMSARRDELIRRIESENEEPKLRKVVQAVWRGIEDACKVERKPRYA